MVSYRIIVQPSKNCAELVNFIHRNIDKLNGSGVFVRINLIEPSNIDEQMMELLKRHSISRFPVIIGPDKRPLVGLDIAKQVLSGHVQPKENRRFAGTGDPIMDYMLQDCFEHNDKGEIVPRSISESAYEEALPNDINARASAMAQQRQVPNPANRRAPAPKQQEPPVDDYLGDDTYQDNIDNDEDHYVTPINRHAPTLTKTGDTVGDDLDARIYQALMQKL